MLISLRFPLFFLVTLFASVLSLSAAEDIPSFVIETRVNNDVITNFDLEQRKLLLTLLNIQPEKDKSNITNQLIDEQLQFQFAQVRKIFLSIEEIDSKIDKFLINNSLNKSIFLKELKENNIEWQTFVSYISSNALWNKTLLQLYANKAKISEHELNLPLLSNTIGRNKLLKLSEIVIPFSERGKDKAILLAKRLQLELNSRGDFSNAAKRFSRSKSSLSGGDLGFIEEKVLPKQIKKLLLDLSVNEVSKPVVLDNSVVIFKLFEKINKKIHRPLDYLMTFIEGTEDNIDGIKACSNQKKYNSKTVLLSQLNKERSHILRLSHFFKVVNLQTNEWIILCNREIKGEIDQINQKKAVYFNNKMITFSEKLMLKLYREAIIS